MLTALKRHSQQYLHYSSCPISRSSHAVTSLSPLASADPLEHAVRVHLRTLAQLNNALGLHRACLCQRTSSTGDERRTVCKDGALHSEYVERIKRLNRTLTPTSHALLGIPPASRWPFRRSLPIRVPITCLQIRSTYSPAHESRRVVSCMGEYLNLQINLQKKTKISKVIF